LPGALGAVRPAGLGLAQGPPQANPEAYHANPLDQGINGVPASGFAQYPQQFGNKPQVVEADLSFGIAGQQRTDCLVSPSLTQFF
jgi:hypothetical protein